MIETWLNIVWDIQEFNQFWYFVGILVVVFVQKIFHVKSCSAKLCYRRCIVQHFLFNKIQSSMKLVITKCVSWKKHWMQQLSQLMMIKRMIGCYMCLEWFDDYKLPITIFTTPFGQIQHFIMQTRYS